MHDITYAQGILNVCLKESKGRKVSRISIELVEDGHLNKHTLSEAFKLVSRGSIAEGAKLDIKTRSFVPCENEEMPHTRVLELEVEEN